MIYFLNIADGLCEYVAIYIYKKRRSTTEIFFNFSSNQLKWYTQLFIAINILIGFASFASAQSTGFTTSTCRFMRDVNIDRLNISASKDLFRIQGCEAFFNDRGDGHENGYVLMLIKINIRLLHNKPSKIEILRLARASEEVEAHKMISSAIIRENGGHNILIFLGNRPDPLGRGLTGLPVPAQLSGSLASRNIYGQSIGMTKVKDNDLIKAICSEACSDISVVDINIVNITDADLFYGLVDRFGQSSRVIWPNKVKNESDLVNNLSGIPAFHAGKSDDENRWLPREYGICFVSNRYFQVIRHTGKWHLVDPEGRAFFSLGVNTVKLNEAATYVENRLALFDALPNKLGDTSIFYSTKADSYSSPAFKDRNFNSGVAFNHLEYNLYVALGRNWRSLWKDKVLWQLSDWGFNTLGSWSDVTLATKAKMPYVITIDIKGDFSRIATENDWWGSVPDPYDPAFENSVDLTLKHTARTQSDTLLIGYFVDNELAWGSNSADWRRKYAVSLAALRGDSRIFSKRAITDYLIGRYEHTDKLENAWGVPVPKGWGSFLSSEIKISDNPNKILENDLKYMSSLITDRYFELISKHLKKHDPNHLYLGSRFSIDMVSDEAIDSCKKYCDVMSVNVYSRNPVDSIKIKVGEKLPVPIIISEFSFPTAARGALGRTDELYVDAYDQAKSYSLLIRNALENPDLVGLHWFQYSDTPLTGRTFDGASGHGGLVDITASADPEFIAVVKRCNHLATGAVRRMATKMDPGCRVVSDR